MKTLLLMTVLLLTIGWGRAEARARQPFADTLQARKWYEQAMSYQLSGQYVRAQGLFGQAAVLYRRHQQWVRLFDCHNQVARAWLLMGKFEQALVQARQVIRESTARLGNDNNSQANACHLIGLVYKEKGDYDQALVYNRQVLDIRVKVFGQSHRAVANTYGNIGNIYLVMGAYDQALQHYRQGLRIRLETQGEVHPDVAVSYLNIANIYERKGEVDKAREYYEKAFRLWQQTQGQADADVAASYHNIGGGVYYKKGEYQKALASYQKALEIRRRDLGEVHEDVADSYIYIGRVYYRQADYGQALAYYQQALQIRHQLFGQVHAEVADAHANIGLVYRKQARYDQALASHHQALQIRRQVLSRHHPFIAISCNSIGELYRIKGQDHQALRLFQQAMLANVPSFRDTVLAHNPVLTRRAGAYLDARALWQSLQAKAACQQRLAGRSQNLADLLLAYRSYCSADTLAQQIQHAYAGENDQVAFTATALAVYQQALAVCLQLHARTGQAAYLEQAFCFAERGKAGVLAATLAESRARAFAGIPDSLLRRDQALRAQSAGFARQIAQELARGPALDSSRLQACQNQLFALQRQQESLESGFEKDYPHYYRLKYPRPGPAPAQLQRVLQPRTAVLEYVLTDTLLHQFIFTRSTFTHRSVVLDSLFRRRVAAFREAILARDQDLYRQVGSQLYRLLLPPALPAGIRQLILIPGEELATLPFEALPAQPARGRPGTCLLHRYAVSYAYSAGLLYEQLTQTAAAARPQLLALAPVFADTRGPAAASRDLPAAAGPLAPEDMAAATGRRQTGPDRPYAAPLLASRQEVETIARLFRAAGAPVQVYFDGQAREEQLKNRDLSAYTYLHLATHGLVNERYPELSGLLLAADSTGREDGVLYWGELYNLRLQAELVTLSACETGLGTIAPGEGVIGLSRALLYAGARNILVSLWKVNDNSTAEFMKHFYKALLQGRNKAQALQKAKKKLVRQGPYDQAYYWAPFILVGR